MAVADADPYGIALTNAARDADDKQHAGAVTDGKLHPDADRHRHADAVWVADTNGLKFSVGAGPYGNTDSNRRPTAELHPGPADGHRHTFAEFDADKYVDAIRHVDADRDANIDEHDRAVTDRD